MKTLAPMYVWWPRINTDVEKGENHCPRQYSRGLLVKALLHPLEWPAGPLYRIHVDFVDYNGQNLAVIMDAYLKCIGVHAITTATSTSTIERLRQFFATQGQPHILVSDNGPCFTSSELTEFTKRNGILHKYVSPHYQASKSLAEPSVWLVKKGLKMSGVTQETKISRFLLT